MALKFAKKGIGAKVEATPGTDPTVTADDAIQTIGFDITPIEANVVDLAVDRSTLGAVEQVSIGNGVSCTFGVYMAGRGGSDPTVQPAYDSVIQGVGFSGFALSVEDWATGTAYATGSVVTDGGTHYEAIAPNTGDSNNQPSSGASSADFWKEVEDWAAAENRRTGDLVVRTTKVYRAHAAHTTAAENAPDTAGGRRYWHEYSNSYVYRPNSDDPKTIWIDANLDGNQHVIKSARGNMSCAFVAGALPQYAFTYQGFYEDPLRTKGLPFAYGNYVTPQGVTNRDTPNAVLHGQRVVMNTLNFDLGNEIVRIDEPGAESIELNNRSVSGNILIEMPEVDVFDWFTRIKDLTKGGLYVEHGNKAGNKTTIFAPNVSLASPTVEDNAGRYMLNIPLRFIPRDGDDDIEIRTL